MEKIDAQLQAKTLLWCDFFGGWEASDVDLLGPYRCFENASENTGELLDWLGIRTDLALHSWVTIPPAGFVHVHELPIPNDQIHAETIEYVALVIALERAQASGSGQFTAIELGASYGPWVTAAGVLASRSGFSRIDLTAVEASEQTIPKIIEHATRNGLTGRPDVAVRALHAAVHVSDEAVYFPRVDVSADNGAQASTKSEAVDYRGLAVEYDRVQGVTLTTLCQDKARVDFLHLDLQGAEENLLQNASFISALDTKVATFFLATQSRLIEGLALKALSSLGWRVIRERPTTYQQNDRTMDVNGWATRDGGQLWLNPRFSDEHLNT